MRRGEGRLVLSQTSGGIGEGEQTQLLDADLRTGRADLVGGDDRGQPVGRDLGDAVSDAAEFDDGEGALTGTDHGEQAEGGSERRFEGEVQAHGSTAQVSEPAGLPIHVPGGHADGHSHTGDDGGALRLGRYPHPSRSLSLIRMRFDRKFYINLCTTH